MRLIDADLYADAMREKQNACKELAQESSDEKNWSDYDHWYGVYATFIESKLTLDSIPTVDAVPVIRCKDCRYGTLHCDDLGIRSVSCNHPSNFFKPWYLRPDFYCADGVRRSENDS